MYVPNYIPEPLEVPQNITLAPYSQRLVFIRRVVVLHAVSVGIAGLFSLLPLSQVGLGQALLALATVLIALDVVRILYRGRSVEAPISCWFLLPVLLLAGWTVKEAALLGLPVWSIGIGPLAVLLYTFVCGRDFSFVGAWALSLIPSSLLVTAIYRDALFSADHVWALGLSAVFLTFVVYDMAALMARRRQGEELAAVVDLYRDVFNIFGYIPRVVSHWRRHKIWARL